MEYKFIQLQSVVNRFAAMDTIVMKQDISFKIHNFVHDFFYSLVFSITIGFGCDGWVFLVGIWF